MKKTGTLNVSMKDLIILRDMIDVAIQTKTEVVNGHKVTPEQLKFWRANVAMAIRTFPTDKKHIFI